MQYGFFDNENREYVITRPDTPAPWANYLGTPAYGAIISNNAGGYSFAGSGADGRILRYVFNGFDRPGRYIYLRDNGSSKYWSASWQPVGRSLEEYRCECRHGMGYSRFLADFEDIHTEALYYVPLEQFHEVWMLRIQNRSGKTRELTVTGYAEFTSSPNYEQDQVNLQYSRFITRTRFDGNRVTQLIHGNLDALDALHSVDSKQVTERFFGLAGAPVDSWCGDRSAFLGAYHGYGDPVGVSAGRLGNVANYNENSCGALSAKLILPPGAEETLCFVLGEQNMAEAERILKHYNCPKERCKEELSNLKTWWVKKLDRFQIKTPSPEFDTMVNTWNVYNCFMTFLWSRAASFIYCGLRNGYGYRDTVQDIQGILHLAPELALEKLRFMLSAQTENGGGLPLVKYTHTPGHEDTPEDESYVRETGHPAYRADDALWLFPTVYKYVASTGELAFLDEVIPFADRGEGTVYAHLRRALNFSAERLGPHGMPAGLYADWNDCLRLGKNGESTFVAFQYYYAMGILECFAREKGDSETVARMERERKDFSEKVNSLCWDGDRFIRGFTEEGVAIGRGDAPEANLWLNPQSWAVISGMANREQAMAAMDLVEKRLNTEYGAILMDPPYHAHAFDGALAVIYNAGVKENAGIFSQTQGWLILAEALCGNGDRAFRYFMENAPAAQNDRAERRVLEPYCWGQFTEGPASPHFGRSHVHWLTGTASTVMVGCVEGILGFRPDLHGLRLSPAIPSAWESLEVTGDFRGKRLHITISNPNRKNSGCASLTVNGRAMADNYIPEELFKETNEILLVL